MLTQIDERLSRDMEAVLEVVALGTLGTFGGECQGPAAAASEFGSTRAIPSSIDAAGSLQDLILDELNVKSLEPLD